MPEPHVPREPGLVESYRTFNPRLALFTVAIVAGLAVLAAGLAHRQLLHAEEFSEKGKVQSQLRILVPGPRGDIYDREGRLLVGNRPRFAVVLHLDELRQEFRRSYLEVRRAYRESGDQDLPTPQQLEHIARHAVVERYLARINAALGRETRLDAAALRRHYLSQRILPFPLIEDLNPEEYARLLEQLPVNSPLQVYTSSTRYYPHGATAAHTLGYVSRRDDIEAAPDFPGADLTTFRMLGTVGSNGLEATFDERLTGRSGGSIYRVDPGGFRVEALERRRPVQGQNLVTSLDLDLQLAAERAMAQSAPGLAGAAVALDVATGEVLVLASKPDYDLNAFSPRLSNAAAADIAERGAWLNRATQGLYAPGSTFKILTAIAGMRGGWITPSTTTRCTGYHRVGGRLFACHSGRAHGELATTEAISRSCNVFFYEHGIATGVEAIAAESRRFGFGALTGIELPHETPRTLVPDPAWKRAQRGEPWFPGDTANFSIGQGFLLVTPLQMAAFTASVARGQLLTPPSLRHDPERPPLRGEAIGLGAEGYASLLAGMHESTLSGTARVLQAPFMRIPGLRIAGKTGTAQKATPEGNLNFAWFICFAPVERPRIAIAVMIEGDTPGEEAAGGIYSVPIARAILKAWADKFPDQIPPGR
jgi:penicillin-binding protein 2